LKRGGVAFWSCSLEWRRQGEACSLFLWGNFRSSVIQPEVFIQTQLPVHLPDVGEVRPVICFATWLEVSHHPVADILRQARIRIVVVAAET
jgi:hypothetical protein